MNGSKIRQPGHDCNFRHPPAALHVCLVADSEIAASPDQDIQSETTMTAPNPPSADTRAAAESRSPDTTCPARKPILLLVNDDRQIHEIFARLMQRLEIPVAQADSAEEGADMARKLKPSVIVTDINLNGGSSLQLIEQIKTDPLTCFASVLAWSSDPTCREAALAAGAVDFIEKGDQPMHLIQRLRELLLNT